MLSHVDLLGVDVGDTAFPIELVHHKGTTLVQIDGAGVDPHRGGRPIYLADDHRPRVRAGGLDDDDDG